MAGGGWCGVKWTPAVDQAELETARRRGYVVLRSVRSMAGLYWKRECQQQRRPYVEVRAFRMNGEVTLDLTPAGAQLTDAEMNAVIAAIRRHGEGSHREDPASFVARHRFTSPRIPLVNAERLADELAALTRNPAG